MNANPYQPPEIEAAALKRRGGWLFKFLAIGCWLLAAVFVLGSLDALRHPDMALRWQSHPVIFLLVCVQVFVLPVAFLLLGGCAFWLRSKRIGLYAGITILTMIPIPAGFLLIRVLRQLLAFG